MTAFDTTPSHGVPMNVANLNKLITHLRRVPRETFDLGIWFVRTFERSDPLLSQDFYLEARDAGDVRFDLETAHVEVIDAAWATEAAEDPFKCSTVGCIAGHAALLLAAETGNSTDGDISGFAQDWLGLASNTSNQLFTPSELPKPYVYSDVTPEIAARVCERLRDTGVVDWEHGFGVISAEL